ncbi:MAG: hypothetical protein ACKO37_03980 [Vampirovibrionales bacterium]
MMTDITSHAQGKNPVPPSVEQTTEAKELLGELSPEAKQVLQAVKPAKRKQAHAKPSEVSLLDPDLPSEFGSVDTAHHSIQRLQLIIKCLPLWVRQVIYSDLKKQLEDSPIRSIKDSINLIHALQHYYPKLTPRGEDALRSFQKALQTHPQQLTDSHYRDGKFLEVLTQEMPFLDICMQFRWSLKQGSLQLMHCFEKDWVHQPTALTIDASLKFLGDRIKLGEYLLMQNAISQSQLDQALRVQGYIEEALGGREGIGNILMNMGLVSREAVEGILYLKEDSTQDIYWPN